MTKIYGMPQSKVLSYKYSEQVSNFLAFSDIIGLFSIPEGFTHDWESVPFFKGTSPVSGLIHDYLSRYDSIPIVTKKKAADVYLEFLKYRGQSFIRRYTKYWIVRLAPGYFHKKSINWKPEIKE